MADTKAPTLKRAKPVQEWDWDKLPGARPMGEFLDELESANKDARLGIRVAPKVIEIYKAAARRTGIPYQRLIRQVIQDGARRLSEM